LIFLYEHQVEPQKYVIMLCYIVINC